MLVNLYCAWQSESVFVCKYVNIFTIYRYVYMDKMSDKYSIVLKLITFSITHLQHKWLRRDVVEVH